MIQNRNAKNASYDVTMSLLSSLFVMLLPTQRFPRT